MPRPSRSVLAAILVASGISGVSATDVREKPKPEIAYWHLWTDAAGQSHLTQCHMAAFTLASMNKPADPQWQDKVDGKASITFTQQPAGWNGAWHEDPHVQFVVPLTGTWFVQAQDGSRAEMGPGMPFLGEDQNTVPDANGHKGHLSGNVGNGPVTLVIASLDAAPKRNQPCHVK